MKELLDRVPAGKAALGVVFVAALVAVCPVVFGTWPDARQAQPAASPAPSAEVSCEDCHTCKNPTAENPCLRPCIRPKPAEVVERFPEEFGPSVVILDELEDLYLPVPFDHRGHAEMAAMTQGCALCHHHTPETGGPHPACKTCHEVGSVRADIRKLGLRGAYHRQCLDCHREWGGAEQCAACHQAKTPAPGQTGPAGVPTIDDLKRRMPSPVPEPDEQVYETKLDDSPAAKAVFRHQDHVHRFGLRCGECHREESCQRCHQEGWQHVRRLGTSTEHHQACSACHEVDEEGSCKRCHWGPGEPKPPRFEHASTGWPLSRYHRDRSCRVCHKPIPFAKLDRECDSCHSGWEPGSFNHAVTGQLLDENHVETDCEECHIDRKFEARPTCGECHDEDEGITFPEKRPGPVTTTAPAP